MTKLTEADLQKGVAALKDAASKNNPLARQAELFQKSQDGTISAEEKDELVKSLNGGGLAERATSGLATDTIKKSIDVSDFLRDTTSGITAGLQTLAESIQKSQGDDHAFKVALATTVAGLADAVQAQGEMMKSMASQMGIAMAQPARGPKSQGVRTGAQPLNKSFGGQPTAPTGQREEGLSKSQIADALDEMHLKKGLTHVAGIDLVKAISKYEATSMIDAPVLAEVQKHIASKNHAA